MKFQNDASTAAAAVAVDEGPKEPVRNSPHQIETNIA